MDTTTSSEQSWAFYPDSMVLIHIVFSIFIWIGIHNSIMHIPLPEYKIHKNADGKPVKISKLEIVEIRNRMVSFLHDLTLFALSAYDI